MPLLLPLSRLLVSPLKDLNSDSIPFSLSQPPPHLCDFTLFKNNCSACWHLGAQTLQWPSFLLSPTPLSSGHTFGVCTIFSMQISNTLLAAIWIQFKQISQGVVCWKLWYVGIGRRWTFKKWSLVGGPLVPKGAASPEGIK